MMLFAADPLLVGDFGWDTLAIMLGKVVIAFALLMLSVLFMVWFERKVVSDLQNRIGPNRAGPWGLLQTLADGIKLFFKEDLVPNKADRFVFGLAPYLSLIPAFLTFAIVPVGGDFTNNNGVVPMPGGEQTYLQVADPPIGVLLFLAMSSLAVYGIMLAGWSSGSKYPLLGSVRASAQMVSYEAALGLAVVAVLIQSESLSSHDIVAAQQGGIVNWNFFATGVVPFFVFLIAGTAELNRPPFDLVEAEQELVGGFHTEYSSIRFALFFLAEFMNTVTMSAIIVTLFLGGPNGPILIDSLGWFFPTFWFMLKLFVFLFTFVWFRATLPRLRYDQLMDLGWKLLIPISLGWVLFLGAQSIGRDRGWNSIAIVAVTALVFAVAGSLLVAAINTAKADRARALEEDPEGAHGRFT